MVSINLNLLMSHHTKSTTKNTITVGIEHFKCPISTCFERVSLVPASIAAHLNAKHKQIASRMHLTGQSADKAYAFFCKSCKSYTNKLHAICHECECDKPEGDSAPCCFPSKAALNTHLKADHTKWWYEKKCNFGKKCHGILGGCGFVHHDIPALFITLDEPRPKHLCQFERPWEGVRCLRDQCSFAHFRGRVRYLIKSRALKQEQTEAPEQAQAQAQAQAPEQEQAPEQTQAPELTQEQAPEQTEAPEQTQEQAPELTLVLAQAQVQVQAQEQTEAQVVFQTPQLTSEVHPTTNVNLKPDLDVSPIPHARVDCPSERVELESLVKKLETVFDQIEKDESNTVVPVQPHAAKSKDDDGDDACDGDEDRYWAYDCQVPVCSGGGGKRKQKKQSPYTTRHARIHEEHMARARQRTVVKNAERVLKITGTA